MKTSMRRTGMFVCAIIAIAVVSFAAAVYWASCGALTPEEYEQGFVDASADAPEGNADGRYTIVTYNVGYGSGLTNNSGYNASESEYEANEAAIVGALHGVEPDVVAYQEIDYDCDRSYHRDQLAIFADALGMKYRAKAFNWDKNHVPWPFWPPSGHFKQILSGQAVSSKFPVRQHRKLTLPMPSENPFWYNRFYLDRIVEIAELEVGDHTLVVMNLHLEAYRRRTREAQAALVAGLAEQYADKPVIILGDFNARPPWRTEDDQTMAIVLAAKGIQTALPEEAFEGDGARLCFSSSSKNPRKSIDHILYNEHIECLSARVLQDAGTGSDHLPVMMEFAFAG